MINSEAKTSTDKSFQDLDALQRGSSHTARIVSTSHALPTLRSFYYKAYKTGYYHKNGWIHIKQGVGELVPMRILLLPARAQSHFSWSQHSYREQDDLEQRSKKQRSTSCLLSITRYKTFHQPLYHVPPLPDLGRGAVRPNLLPPLLNRRESQPQPSAPPAYGSPWM